MRKKKTQPNYRHRTLRLPDLDRSKLAVLNFLCSPGLRRVYEYYALDSGQQTQQALATPISRIRRSRAEHVGPPKPSSV
jgi:hypothetical protein